MVLPIAAEVSVSGWSSKLDSSIWPASTDVGTRRPPRSPASTSGATPSKLLHRKARSTALHVVARASSGTQAGVARQQHVLQDGMKLEVLHRPPAAGTASAGRPPLLFIHGAMHAAWCYEEHFLPYFSERGYDSYAVSLRSHGGSDKEGKPACSFDDHMSDIAQLVSSLPAPPVVIAHSLGGVILQRYLLEVSQGQQHPPLAGAVLMAAAALTHLAPTLQYFREQHSLLHSLKVVWWMGTGGVRHASTTKEMLFSPLLEDAHYSRYHAQLNSFPRVMMVTLADVQRVRPQVGDPLRLPPVHVIIAGRDAIIMPHQVHATARLFGVEAAVVPEVAHDVMLDVHWEAAAREVESWLQANCAALPRELFEPSAPQE